MPKILYKYVNMHTAKQILTTNSIRFSNMSSFNDPCDRPELPIQRMGRFSNPTSHLVRANMKGQVWEETTGVLCLTRSATNALMWAHYGNSHKGMIIGFNTARAGFLIKTKNMIPAQFGSVIYTRDPDKSPNDLSDAKNIIIGHTFKYIPGRYEQFQKLFLTKPLDWAYEEEVRVVKCLGGLSEVGTSEIKSGKFTSKNYKDELIHLYNLPNRAISEIHFGMNASQGDMEKISKLFKGKCYHCRRIEGSYKFLSEPI